LDAYKIVDDCETSHIGLLESENRKELLALATVHVENPQRIMLYGFEVHENHRRQGLSGHLLRGVFDFAKKQSDEIEGPVNVVVEAYSRAGRLSLEPQLIKLSEESENVGYLFD